jgi:glycosyltransferase involved in cell wall biosynthesis
MSPDRSPGASRLLVHDYGGHAFTAQLARQLARRGHRTTYLSFADFVTPKGRVDLHAVDPPLFEARQLSIGRRFDKDNLLVRRYHEHLYARLVARQVLAANPTTVISANAPLPVQAALLRSCRRIGAKFVFWLQDVHSEAIARILGRRSSALGALARHHFNELEGRLLRASDHVVVICDDFARCVGPDGWGVPPARIALVENWAPLEDIPLLSRDNPWSRRHFRPGRRRIVYAGTLARKHDPEVLVQLAQRLDVDVHLLSVGSGADHVARRAAELRLANLFVEPWVGPDEFPSVLAGADLCCAFIEADAGGFSVPSKVLA